jgi:hypothetical protein
MMSAKFKLHTSRTQYCNLSDPFLGPRVCGGDFRSTLGTKQRRGNTRASQPYGQDALSP